MRLQILVQANSFLVACLFQKHFFSERKEQCGSQRLNCGW